MRWWLTLVRRKLKNYSRHALSSTVVIPIPPRMIKAPRTIPQAWEGPLPVAGCLLEAGAHSDEQTGQGVGAPCGERQEGMPSECWSTWPSRCASRWKRHKWMSQRQGLRKTKGASRVGGGAALWNPRSWTHSQTVGREGACSDVWSCPHVRWATDACARWGYSPKKQWQACRKRSLPAGRLEVREEAGPKPNPKLSTASHLRQSLWEIWTQEEMLRSKEQWCLIQKEQDEDEELLSCLPIWDLSSASTPSTSRRPQT